MKEKGAQHDFRETGNPGSKSGRSPYVAPEITFVEELEAVANECVKGAGGGCGTGLTS